MEKSWIKKFWFMIPISIIIGFLPSFIFVYLFIQYGSPIENYFNFLSNISSSWAAWILSIVISGLIFLISLAIIQRKKLKKVLKKNRFIILVFAVCLSVIFLLVATQLYLYVNFILRNDILVRLSADNSDVFFTDNSNQDITFKISVITNPFCSSECQYEFSDLSSNEVLSSGSFKLTTISTEKREFTLENKNLPTGSQEINVFDVSCKSKKSFLCYTQEKESKRKILVTLNYELTEEDELFKKESENTILEIEDNFLNASEILNLSKRNFENAEIYFDSEIILEDDLIDLENSILGLKNLWEAEDFEKLRENLEEVRGESVQILEEVELNSEKLLEEINFYKNLSEDFSEIKTGIESVGESLVLETFCENINSMISDFNLKLEEFNSERNLEEKKIILDDLQSEFDSFYYSYLGNLGESSCVVESLNEVGDLEIELRENFEFDFELKEPESVCCLRGVCDECCVDECADSNYPIIFLHGHIINKELPADYSLDSFVEMKDKLEEDNYVDAGAFIISSDSKTGLWGKMNMNVLVTAGYFFDTYEESGEEITVSSKSDSIDTYSIRLKNIVELIKERTGKDKVVIVAHSMGGLVARRYVQIFGAENVDKLVLITVPNHGIEDKVKDYCKLIGPESSCSEMEKESLFMNKLNSGQTESVPTYNIIGIGCDMGDETGEGIVKNSSQYLESAENYYVEGECDEFNFDYLHENIINPNLYPETYEILKEILL